MRATGAFFVVCSLFASTAHSAVLCTARTGSGTLRIRAACKSSEVQVDPATAGIQRSVDLRALVDQAFLFAADAVDGMDPDMIAMTRALARELGPDRICCLTGAVPGPGRLGSASGPRVYRSPTAFSDGSRLVRAPAWISVLGRILLRERPRTMLLGTVDDGIVGRWLQRWGRLAATGTRVVVYDPMAMPNAQVTLGERVAYAASADECANAPGGASMAVRWIANPFLDVYRELTDRFPALWVLEPSFPEYMREFGSALHGGDAERAISLSRVYYQRVDRAFIQALTAVMAQRQSTPLASPEPLDDEPRH